MNDEELKKQIFTFLQSKFITVIATITPENKPEAATIYYIVDEDFSMYFIAGNNTSKSKNIINNPNVALVVGTDNIPITAQIEGLAQKVTDLNVIPTLLGRLAKVSNQNEYAPPAFALSNDNMNIFKVTPAKIKWLDMTEAYGEHIRKEIIFPQ